jgi:hypothetical protein
VSRFGSGLVFVPLFGYILGDVSEAEVGTGSGLLNAVQQFSGAIGVAALGTVFFQRVTADGAFVGATQVVLLLGTVLYAVTLALVGLLPKVAQEEHASPDTRELGQVVVELPEQPREVADVGLGPPAERCRHPPTSGRDGRIE